MGSSAAPPLPPSAGGAAVGDALGVGVAVIVGVDVGTGVALLVALAVGDPVGSGPFVQALNTSTPATATAPTAATRIDVIVRIFPPKPLRDNRAEPTLSNAFTPGQTSTQSFPVRDG